MWKHIPLKFKHIDQLSGGIDSAIFKPSVKNRPEFFDLDLVQETALDKRI